MMKGVFTLNMYPDIFICLKLPISAVINPGSRNPIFERKPEGGPECGHGGG